MLGWMLIVIPLYLSTIWVEYFREYAQLVPLCLMFEYNDQHVNWHLLVLVSTKIFHVLCTKDRLTKASLDIPDTPRSAAEGECVVTCRHEGTMRRCMNYWELSLINVWEANLNAITKPHKRTTFRINPSTLQTTLNRYIDFQHWIMHIHTWICSFTGVIS